MEYAIAGLYVIVAGAGVVLFRILHQLKLSDTYNQIRQALQDILVPELREIKRELQEIGEKITK